MGRQGFQRLAKLPRRYDCWEYMTRLHHYITLYERRNIKSVAESVCERGLQRDAEGGEIARTNFVCYNLCSEAIFER